MTNSWLAYDDRKQISPEQVLKVTFHSEVGSQGMLSTTRHEPHPTLTNLGSPSIEADPKLLSAYERLVTAAKLSWTGHYHLLKLLGRGGQGEVYLSEYRGTDEFTVPVAMKIFSPSDMLALAVTTKQCRESPEPQLGSP